MNAFANAYATMSGRTDANGRLITRTENGMRARTTTSSAAVDLFGSIGASRGKDVTPQFAHVYGANKDLGLRIAQWARDIRGGAGERKIFRDILKWLEEHDPQILIESRLLDNVAEIGRFDDLLIFRGSAVKYRAYDIIAKALEAGNGLAAKWLPRKGPIAIELREFLGITPKHYRKLLVNLTKVVETQMCAQNWNEINFSHVPSVAMSKYMTAFHKNAPEAFQAYKDALKKGVKGVKVNASAVYPYSVVKLIRPNHYSFIVNDNTVAEEMWKALPNYMNDQNVLPLVDVSGSMSTSAPGNKDVSCMDVALSLGLYCSEKSTGPLKDMFLTFSARPQMQKLSGSLAQRLSQLASAHWEMNTNLHAAFDEILTKAQQFRVSADDMPKILLILSDMQFDACVRHDDSALQMIRRKYENAGYEMPAVVFWNLNDYGNKPVKFNDQGTALVSGFSPAIMKAVLAADLEDFTPESVMMKAIGIDRYNW